MIVYPTKHTWLAGHPFFRLPVYDSKTRYIARQGKRIGVGRTHFEAIKLCLKK